MTTPATYMSSNNDTEEVCRLWRNFVSSGGELLGVKVPTVVKVVCPL